MPKIDHKKVMATNPMTGWRLGLATGAAVIAVGCGGSGDSGDSAGNSGGSLATTADTAGAGIRVVNFGVPPEWGLALVGSIGPGPGLAEAGPGEFGEAVSVAFGPGEDAVYVADRQNCEVRVFGIDGTHQRTFGRCGEGPGEFTRFLWSIAWVGDKLLAFDFGGGRIGEIAEDGEWLGQRKTIGVPGGSWVQALYPIGGGEAYAYAFTAEPGSSGRLGLAWYGHDAMGETADTVFPPAEPEHGAVRCTWQGEDFFTFEYFDNPYAPRTLAHPGPDGTLFTAASDEYRIAVTRGSDTLRTVARELAPEPLTDHEWDGLADQFDAWLNDQMPDGDCNPPRPVRPSAKPVLEGIFFDAAGRLWVEVIRTAGNRWEVFDADGKLLAQVPASERKETALPALGVRHVATIRRDSLDLDHVDIWRIDRRGTPR